MTLAQTSYITTRELLQNFAQLRQQQDLMVITSDGKPCGMYVPFDEGLFQALSDLVEKTPSQLRAEDALAEYKQGTTTSLDDLRDEYGI